MKPITIREPTFDDAGQIARVHIDSWRTTYRSIVPEAFLASLEHEDRREHWMKFLQDSQYGRTTFALVAEVPDDAIIAFISGGPQQWNDPSYDGEVHALYILERYQRRRIGTQLMRAFARQMKNAGYKSLLVGVVAESPSRRFYEALGGREVRTQQISIGGKPLEEIAYGWPQIDLILDPQKS